MPKGKKWHKLFNLPIQKMYEKETFTLLNLSWSEARYMIGSKIDLVATIPIDKVDDFKRGEENILEAQYNFVNKKYVNKVHNKNDIYYPQKGSTI